MKILSTLISLACTLSAASAANLILNGSFEEPVIQEPFVGVPAGGTIGAWHVGVGADLDLVRTYWPAADGFQSVDLHGPFSGTSLFQDVPTTPGAQYFLSFSFAGNPERPQDKTFDVLWSGAVVGSFTFSQAGTSLGDMGWLNTGLTLNADLSLTRLEFISTTAVNGAGPVLDNISLIPVPEPSAVTLLIVATGGILFLKCRRQSKRS